MEQQFIIDVETYNKKRIISGLRKLKTTIEIEDGGEYHEDRSFSQIWITSTLTEEQLDKILCDRKDMDGFIGVVHRKGEVKI